MYPQTASLSPQQNQMRNRIAMQMMGSLGPPQGQVRAPIMTATNMSTPWVDNLAKQQQQQQQQQKLQVLQDYYGGR